MSLVAVYDALKAANVDDAKATAAVEAIETVREEARLRRIEESIAELRADMNAQNAKLRADMEKGFVEVRAEIGELRADMNAQIGEFRAETNQQNAKLQANMDAQNTKNQAEMGLLKWMCGAAIALGLTNLTIVSAILIRSAS